MYGQAGQKLRNDHGYLQQLSLYMVAIEIFQHSRPLQDVARMQLSIELKSILAYYDGPDVIEATDRFGNQYVGLAQEPERLSFRFLIVRASARQVSHLSSGIADLRSTISESSQLGWYECETDSLEAPISLGDQIDGPIPDNLLPAEGYFLVDSIQNQNLAMDEATSRHNFVVHLKLEPKDRLRAHRIKLKDYGDLILALNALVFTTHPKALPTDTQIDKSKLELDIVTPAAAGSLEIVLEATNQDNDLFQPHHMLVSGMKHIDDALSRFNDIEHIKELSERVGANFAKKFLELMRALVRCDVDFSYSWAEPRFRLGSTNTVSHSKTKEFVDSLRKSGADILYRSECEITGRFHRFDRPSGKWGLNTSEGLIVGTIGKTDRPKMLDGLQVEQLYTFVCDEEQTFAQAWRGERPSLILRSVKRES